MATTPGIDEGLPPTLSDPTEQGHETAQIARAASVISLGNIASRVLGLAREVVTSSFFGAGALVDAFSVATIVPTMISDLLIGGMVNSALVPVFSEYAQGKKEDLWSLVSVVMSGASIILVGFILLGEVFAPQIASLLNNSTSPETVALTTSLLRITIPAVLFINMSAVFSGLLYALKRFTLPAFTAAAYNLAIVIVTLLFHNQIGITAMAIGLLTGAFLQMSIQLPALRDARLRLSFDFSHPGLRKIVLLYMPIILGLLVDILVSRTISYRLASQTGEGGISWMRFATYLIQLPQGLVATAISFAVLPTLSAHAVTSRDDGEMAPFRGTLARGLRLVLVLIVPAAVGLFILSQPVVALLYERGAWLPIDTQMTATALRLYLFGLPFAALDLLLVFAFYALQDTLTPSLVGIGTIAIYLAAAILMLPTFGLFSLMLADSLKHLLHFITAALLLRRRIGAYQHQQFGRTLLVVLASSALMGAATYAALNGIWTGFGTVGFFPRALAVGVPGALGFGLYLLLVKLLRVEEVELLWDRLKARLGR